MPKLRESLSEAAGEFPGEDLARAVATEPAAESTEGPDTKNIKNINIGTDINQSCHPHRLPPMDTRTPYPVSSSREVDRSCLASAAYEGACRGGDGEVLPPEEGDGQPPRQSTYQDIKELALLIKRFAIERERSAIERRLEHERWIIERRLESEHWFEKMSRDSARWIEKITRDSDRWTDKMTRGSVTVPREKAAESETNSSVEQLIKSGHQVMGELEEVIESFEEEDPDQDDDESCCSDLTSWTEPDFDEEDDGGCELLCTPGQGQRELARKLAPHVEEELSSSAPTQGQCELARAAPRVEEEVGRSDDDPPTDIVSSPTIQDVEWAKWAKSMAKKLIEEFAHWTPDAHETSPTRASASTIDDNGRTNTDRPCTTPSTVHSSDVLVLYSNEVHQVPAQQTQSLSILQHLELGGGISYQNLLTDWTGVMKLYDLRGWLKIENTIPSDWTGIMRLHDLMGWLWLLVDCVSSTHWMKCKMKWVLYFYENVSSIAVETWCRLTFGGLTCLGCFFSTPILSLFYTQH